METVYLSKQLSRAALLSATILAGPEESFAIHDIDDNEDRPQVVPQKGFKIPPPIMIPEEVLDSNQPISMLSHNALSVNPPGKSPKKRFSFALVPGQHSKSVDLEASEKKWAHAQAD
ncbi:MAG: hypothetical protein NTX76_00290 [Alphaproteobacteria bacterium]|nr:hypothetical protein [Alphaproteobacteria bacterium]